jgi:hypothetical protein
MTNCDCKSYQEYRYDRLITMHECCRKCEPVTYQDKLMQQAKEAHDFIWDYREGVTKTVT